MTNIMIRTNVVLHLITVTFCLTERPPIVNTSCGRLQGSYMRSRDGRKFSAFLGIPYAAPPMGELRFCPPVSPQGWHGVREATQEGNICSQGKYGGSEDCLFVNVFTSYQPEEPQRPVMVYIHGGSFYMGSPSLGITGPEYFMDRDVVLVTVRYRLGPFGFMSTEDSVIPANIGLKDQVKALEWVKDNIHLFGGDPGQVTLFGCSAGATSVHLHMQSLQSQHLFVRGISQSGTALSPFAMMKKSSSVASTVQLLLHLKCPTNGTEILKCLQNKTTAEIDDAHSYLQDLGYKITKCIFRPVLEDTSNDSFLTFNPLSSQTNKPWLTGITSNEGILNIRNRYLHEIIRNITHEFNVFIPKALLINDICSSPHVIANHIHEFYFNNSSIKKEIITSIEEMFTDCWFLWPLEEASRHHQGTVYRYVFGYQGEHSYTTIYDSPSDHGVSHLDDLLYLFRHSAYHVSLNEVDETISRIIIDMWVNFATYGDPTPDFISSNPLNKSGTKDFKWIPYTTSNPVHLDFNATKLGMKTDIYPNRLAFWKRLNIIDRYP